MCLRCPSCDAGASLERARDTSPTLSRGAVRLRRDGVGVLRPDNAGRHIEGFGLTSRVSVGSGTLAKAFSGGDLALKRAAV